MCTDFRGLNAITKKIFIRCPERAICSTTHTEGDQHKTAFRTTFGSFEYVITPFGLSNAGPHFQRLMDDMFKLLLLDKKICIYIDDILIMTQSEDIEDHIRDIDNVFSVLSKNKMKVKLSKCEFAARSLIFLGHIVGYGIIKPMHDKVESIRNWTVPKTKAEIKSFFLKDQFAIGINGRINRWMQFIESFDPVLRYIKGDTNVVPDGLSRHTFATEVVNAMDSGNFKNSLIEGYQLEQKMILSGEIKEQEIYKKGELKTVDGLKYAGDRSNLNR
eukprot:gene1543-1803_t